jgi:hypothetical protein
MSRYEELSVGTLLTTGESLVTTGVGTKEGTETLQNAFTVTERGNDVLHKTEFSFVDYPLTVLDASTGVGVKIYTFPVGRISQQGANGSIALTTTSALASTLNASSTLAWGVGSVTQAGNTTLATTEQNFVQTTAVTSSATVDVAGAATGGVGLPVLASLDGTSSAVALFLNFAVATATDIDANATVLVNGSVTVYWINQGIY